ncbi:MAG: glycosyltransferase family 39 protein [Muribaculaceae bacterium]|nr:glycosyltransferase family 39 protein [Muribaculaceae bacterium]
MNHRADSIWPRVAVLLLVLLTFLPWLGLTPFNTKGEPREAIVAVSMLESGNWILPESMGADIPYKPPFLAWCIALLSVPWGEVTEYTSRLPSALAVSAMAMMMFCFVRRRLGGFRAGALTALVTVTNIEVWRAGMACRVDMVLTAFMTGAMIALYRYRERGYRGMPWVAVLCMSCAVLTKGPVGMLLPCMVAGLYGLLRGDRLWPLFARMACAGLASLILPALWYYAAWLQGGDAFYGLAMEENFGRMTGTMSYESHVKPLWYNFMTVSVGMLPYTLAALGALFVARWKGVPPFFRAWRTWLDSVRRADAAKVFAAVAIIVVFAFYCVPKSKRSVYLLPIYPFVAYYVVLLMEWLCRKAPSLIRAWCGTVAFAVTLCGVSVMLMLAGALPQMSVPVSAVPCVWLAWMLAIAAIGMGLYSGWTLWTRRASWCAGSAVLALMTGLWLMSGAILPAVLSAKSDKGVAMEVNAIVPDGPVYGFVDDPMLRFYTVNYYLDDRMRVYDRELPLEGYLLTGEPDFEEWTRLYGDTYVMHTVRRFGHKSCDRGQEMILVRFGVRPELLAD